MLERLSMKAIDLVSLLNIFSIFVLYHCITASRNIVKTPKFGKRMHCLTIFHCSFLLAALLLTVVLLIVSTFETLASCHCVAFRLVLGVMSSSVASSSLTIAEKVSLITRNLQEGQTQKHTPSLRRSENNIVLYSDANSFLCVCHVCFDSDGR